MPYRHISGAHPPITRSKGNRALKVTKNKLPVRGGEIFEKNQDIRGFVLLHLKSGI